MSNPPNYEYNGSDRDSSIIPTPPPGLPTDDDDIHVIPLHADEADDLFPTHDNLNTLYSPAMQNNRWSTMSRGSAVSHVDVGQYDPTGVPSAMQNRRWSAMSRGSAVSHVDIGHFDPAGVEELRRSLQNSPPPAVQHVKLVPGAELTRQISAKSEVTLTPGDGPIDFEKTLRTIMKRRGLANHKTRELGVMFKNLRVVGLGATASYQPTLGSALNLFNMLKGMLSRRPPPIRDLLSGFEGVVQPGQMLLVLGRPGSGCSTFLKTLANQRAEYYSVEGDVHYDSLSPADIAKHYRGDVTYCPEDDVHFPTLTVDQTLRFAAKTRTPHQRLNNGTRGDFVTGITNILETIFGLKHTKNTPVGDAAIRGVSGGEKKRVSISEALAARSLIGAWDNSTRGLDASTALEFVRALRIATDVARLSTIVSIYQASESLYQHFDKVCVIYAGKMAYFGPADQARQYFIDLGYEPANRQTTADFLVAVTDPLGRIERSDFNYVPRTATEFAEHFQKSEIGRNNQEDIDLYQAEFVGKPQRANMYIESVKAEHAKHTRLQSAYTISIPMQIRAVMVRRIQILRGNLMAPFLQLFSFVFQSLIIGTVFLRVPDATSAYFSRGGALFFSILFSALLAMSEIQVLFAQRPIILRHQKSALYHPFIEAAAMTLVDIPITAITLLVFSTIVYEAVRFQQSASQFFIFYLFLFTVNVTMKAWFRVLASILPAQPPAQALAGISMMTMSLYTGYSIPKPSMIGALRWITYINPIRYGFEAVLTNEFHTLNGACSDLVPRGAGYENITLVNQVCTTIGSLPEQPFVNGDSFVELSYGYSHSHLWRNFGILVGFAGLFIAALLYFTERNAGFAGAKAITLFKRGAKTSAIKDATAATSDEEKITADSGHASNNDIMEARAGAEKALTRTPAMTDIFSWQHVQYTVPLGGTHRRLLDDVSGYVAPGKLTALMGESGAGKTTLLNVLAQRVGTGVVTGDRLVNGQPLPADFQAQTGYCQQMDVHVPNATVREALLFSAKMRQPASVPLAEKEAYVDTCLRMCGLESHADAIIGSLGIEHRKRTTIGVELAAKPKLLLFLDEPTSGLDSQSAWAIVSFLRSLANNGQAILCTIHQPSAELFQVFDRLLLLRKGGQTVYFGDIGYKAGTLINYFERNGSRPCAPDDNPAEFMLDVIGAGATQTSEQDWHNIWRQSNEAAEVQKEINVIHEGGRNRPPVKTSRHSVFAASWGSQVIELVKRGTLNHWRNPTYLIAKLILNIVSGLLIGFTFFKAKDSLAGTQNKLFSIFMSTIISVPLSNQLQFPFLGMRRVFEIRERPSRMYSWSAMVTSLFLTDLPWNILGSSIFYLCWFWTVGFHNDRAGFTYLMMGVAFPMYYTSNGMAVAAMAPNAEMAAVLFSVLFSFVLTFNGVLQPFSNLGWWKWMYRVSPFTYLIEAVVGQAIGKQDITCASVEFVKLNPPSGQTCGSFMQQYISNAGGYLNNPDATSACEFCSSATTDQFLAKTFNIHYSHHWRNFGLVMVYVAFNIFCIYAFTWFFRIRRGSIIGSLKKLFGGRKN